MTVAVATLGFPRIGTRRELKTALENYWSGKIDAAALLALAAELRAQTWKRQRDLGATIIFRFMITCSTPPRWWAQFRRPAAA
jgi:5-methyltetrahydropteroyltriglutamate--homocysteine methyltransferase